TAFRAAEQRLAAVLESSVVEAPAVIADNRAADHRARIMAGSRGAQVAVRARRARDLAVCASFGGRAATPASAEVSASGTTHQRRHGPWPRGGDVRSRWRCDRG